MSSQNLISVHTTPSAQTWASLPFLLIGLLILMAGAVNFEGTAFIVGLVWFLFFFLNSGVPGYPARHLEIYEEGLVYRTLWQTRMWKWSDFIGIRSSYNGAASLYLQDADGVSVRILPLDNWAQVRQLIIGHIEPIVYMRAMNHLRSGKAININFALCIKEYGLSYHGRSVQWCDVDYVEFDSKRVVIHSSQLGTWQQSVSFQTYRMQNGDIYARLIRDLWQAANQEPQLAEMTYIVIDGVHFNSKGEMIVGGSHK
ncbi:MAG: hypothetical protein L0154_19905 [Chloroflexi bacterium]|nr:hypothetical protein [Chloroflexota bacterium]